jgi:hypothetical protein
MGIEKAAGEAETGGDGYAEQGHGQALFPACSGHKEGAQHDWVQGEHAGEEGDRSQEFKKHGLLPLCTPRF